MMRDSLKTKIHITGIVDSIIYKSDDGFTIISVKEKNDTKILIGNIYNVSEGIIIKATAEESYSKGYGLQYKVQNYEFSLPESEEAIIKFLSTKDFNNIGEVIAKRIVDTFGEDTFDVIIENPKMLLQIKGMTAKKIDVLQSTLIKKKSELSTILFLSNFKLSYNDILKILNVYGEETINIIKKNPYQLLREVRGLGFKKIDDIAFKLGIDRDSSERIEECIIDCLYDDYNDGNVYSDFEVLEKKVLEKLSLDNVNFNEYYIKLQLKNRIEIITKDSNVNIYLKHSFDVEYNLSQLLYSMKDRIHIITGGPGTGKTYNIKKIIAEALDKGLSVILCAPTGRAAKRIIEVTNFEAKTIHRTLEICKKEVGNGNSIYYFAKDENNKLDCDILIVDEASMIDESLMLSLVKAIDDKTEFYIVGDVDQLPSVGAGNVLSDMIKSKLFDVKILEVIYRQNENSNIISLAHEINKGIEYEFKNDYDDVKFVKTSTEERICENICTLVSRNIPKYFNISIDKIQVIAPTKKGKCGTVELNKILQKTLNDNQFSGDEIKDGDRVFRVNDKVMQIVNNYDLVYNVYNEDNISTEIGFGVFNGDVGVIKEIDKEEKIIVVQFDDKIVEYTREVFDNLTLAYAITVHKSQGSEYDVVVMPMTYVNHYLSNRKILYTATTRAKKCICFVGKKEYFFDMVRNKYEDNRNSALCNEFYFS